MLSPGVKHCIQHVCQVECTEQVTQWQSKTAANSWRLHVSLMFAEKEQTEVVEGSFDPTALFIFPERAAGPPFPLSRPHWLLYRWHLCKCRTRGAHVTRRKHLSTSGFNIILEAWPKESSPARFEQYSRTPSFSADAICPHSYVKTAVHKSTFILLANG